MATADVHALAAQQHDQVAARDATLQRTLAARYAHVYADVSAQAQALVTKAQAAA